jgi:hypothetical protein
LGETWVEIDRIMEQWMTPVSLCFKVGVGNRVYRLEYYRIQDAWEVELISPA